MWVILHLVCDDWASIAFNKILFHIIFHYISSRSFLTIKDGCEIRDQCIVYQYMIFISLLVYQK
jgi:hypothetical protein